MAIKENQTASDLYLGLAIPFSATMLDVTTTPFDTRDYDNGVTFIPYWLLQTGAATFTIDFKAVEDSADGSTDWQTVPSNQIVARNLNVLADIPEYIAGAATIVSTLGVIGSRRYVRGVIDLTITGPITAFLTVLINAGPEIKRGES